MKLPAYALKVSLLCLYGLLLMDFLYESSMTNAVENVGAGNGGDIGIFGHWWPIVPAVLILTIIALQISMYLRSKEKR